MQPPFFLQRIDRNFRVGIFLGLFYSGKKLLSTGHFLGNEGQARQNQTFLNDESHSQSAMGEEERKSDQAAAVHRSKKMSCTEKKLRGLMWQSSTIIIHR